MKYFVSGDIHGFYDEWQNALNEKDFDLNEKATQIERNKSIGGHCREVIEQDSLHLLTL